MKMFNKIKEFYKKNKKIVLISLGCFLLFILLILVMLLLTKEDEETEASPDGYSDFERREPDLYYQNYEIEVSSDVVEKLSDYEGEYEVYEVMDIDHFEWVEKFFKSLNLSNFQYTVKSHPAIESDALHTIDQTNHIWERGDDEFLHYRVSSDLLTVKFERGVRIPGVQVNPGDKVSVENFLNEMNEKYFSEDFEYVINSIDQEDGYYKVSYSRLLGGVPISLDVGDLYLILTPAGHLKEGWFLLAEFSRKTYTSLHSAEDFVQKLLSRNHSKDLNFTFVDLTYEPENFGSYGYRRTGQEEGNVNVKNFDFSYRYDNKFQAEIAPLIIFKGEGFVDIEGENVEVLYDINMNLR